MADAVSSEKKEVKSEEDRLFDAAFDAVLNTGKKDYPNYVGGLMVASGLDFQIASPMDPQMIFGKFQEAEEGLTDRAVVAATEAFKKWSKVKPSDRAAIFQKVAVEVKKQRYKLAALVTVSVGMTRKEALAEVDRLVEIIDRACSDAVGVKGKPLGVWAVLTSYNSPLAAPIGYSVAAMAAGNTVVLMPSRNAPLPVHSLYKTIADAGLPDGVLNMIIDRLDKSTCALANNAGVAGIVASGSGDRMEDLMFLEADEGVRFINEVKGMNPIFVYKPSNMKEAAKLVIESAFTFSGQHISSCSKVVVLPEEQKALTDALLTEARAMVVSDPSDKRTFTGPVANEAKFKEFNETVRKVKDSIIFGGKVIADERTEGGYYVTPAILAGMSEDDDMNNLDSALPFLSIYVAKDVDDAMENINCTEYGSSAGIITRDERVADQYVQTIQADNVFINCASTSAGAASKAILATFLK